MLDSAFLTTSFQNRVSVPWHPSKITSDICFYFSPVMTRFNKLFGFKASNDCNFQVFYFSTKEPLDDSFIQPLKNTY